MRQTLKDRRLQLHRGTPVSRISTLVIMLAIMGLIFVRLRDPNTWRWLARGGGEPQQVVGEEDLAVGNRGSGEIAGPKRIESGKPATVAAAVPEQVVPAAQDTALAKSSAAADPLKPTGPTDLDSGEEEDARNMLSVIKDGTPEMTKFDMPAYYQLLSWVDHQSTELLRKRAKRDVLYSDFRKTPDTMRLQIVELNLRVLQIVRYTNAPVKGLTQPMTTLEGHPIYEVRGFTREGGSNLYIGVVTDLPKGMPIGDSIDENAKLVGYFFRLQGYISQAQQLEAEKTRRRPTMLQAPIIMGRLIWTPAPAEDTAKTPVWLLLSIGAVAATIIVGWVFLASRRTRKRNLPPVAPVSAHDEEGPAVDSWLDQAQSGRLALQPASETTPHYEGEFDPSLGGRFSGNIFWESNESKNGHASRNGHGQSADYNDQHGDGGSGTGDSNSGSGEGRDASGPEGREGGMPG